MEKFNDILEKIAGLNALELSELVKTMEEKFGITAAMPVGVVAGAGTGETAAAEEKSAWNVLLKDSGSQKIQVIKVIKEVLGIGLQEAKAIVDSAPKVAKEGMKKDEAEDFKKKLEAAGAIVELQ